MMMNTRGIDPKIMCVSNSIIHAAVLYKANGIVTVNNKNATFYTVRACFNGKQILSGLYAASRHECETNLI